MRTHFFNAVISRLSFLKHSALSLQEGPFYFLTNFFFLFFSLRLKYFVHGSHLALITNKNVLEWSTSVMQKPKASNISNSLVKVKLWGKQEQPSWSSEILHCLPSQGIFLPFPQRAKCKWPPALHHDLLMGAEDFLLQ